MTNIIILVHDRPRLTRQTLDTLVKNTTAPYNCIIVVDNSTPETMRIAEEFAAAKKNIKLLISNSQESGCVGALRNLGAKSSEWTFGRGEWLYFSDNDVAFEPLWLQNLQSRLLAQVIQHDGCLLIGGYQHPYHQTNKGSGEFHETDAVAGYSMLMRWATFDKYGPFDANQKGVGASEDFAFCQRIIKDGGKVGYIHPPVLSHCGITNSDGKPAVGAEHFRRAPNTIYE